MIQSSRIREIVSNLVDGTELFIVDITIKHGNGIIVTLDSAKGLSIDECATLSKAIETSLNRDEEDFELEVSSPGLSLPFKVIQQYYKNIGKEVEVLYNNGKKYIGKLLSVDESSFLIETLRKVKLEGKKKPELVPEKLLITFDEIISTRIVINFK
jgi:ribosome maturation factor RimP